MYIRLTRLHNTGTATTGQLLVDGQPICDTLENSHTLIATGMYPVRLTMSPHFGMTLPLIDRVIGRSGIRIHPGNTAADSQGCVLVGETPPYPLGKGEMPRLIHSKQTFLKLMAILLAAQHRREEIWIDVVDETPETLRVNRGYDLATRYGSADWPEIEAVYVFDEITKPI